MHTICEYFVLMTKQSQHIMIDMADAMVICMKNHACINLHNARISKIRILPSQLQLRIYHFTQDDSYMYIKRGIL